MSARLFRRAALIAGALVMLISCSGEREQANPADIPPRTPEPPAVAALPPDAALRPPPTTTIDPGEGFFEKPGFFEELLVALEDLGIGSGHAVCIISRLEERGADETALEAAELDSVLDLDKASQSCLVDLVEHIERASDISRSAARSGR